MLAIMMMMKQEKRLWTESCVVCHVHVEGLVPRWIERLLLRLGLVRLAPVCHYAIGIGEAVPAVSVDWYGFGQLVEWSACVVCAAYVSMAASLRAQATVRASRLGTAECSIDTAIGPDTDMRCSTLDT